MAPLPPLETLRVFEVACRHGSYSEAARELNVTHSAVSQRIRQLEEDLGLTLFERQGNRMMPTPAALRLQAGVKGAFSELGAALGSLQTRRRDAELTVSLLPVMAARWLVPRLSRFTARFPNINLHIKSGQPLANFKSDGVDIAIRFGTGDWKGLRAIKLLDEAFFPVCSPSLNGGRLPKDPVAMLAGPLLIDRNLSWRAWFKSAGLTLDRDIAGTSFTDSNALMEAAVMGQGIALGRKSFTRSDILAGRLVRLSDHSLRVAYCHYAVYPVASESNPALRAFRDWLIEEAQRG
ncbi:transcriptional regulator GcvA [Bradyrhizobium sp. CCBAU 51753]|uniref:transcriptional regulator GcvA n=1 Tax=Bradyrhizobium sp. CCBAU 51753 TaxID=1325100 RepID=UPI00188CBC5B|nr:transcriptional regulator GcvA [Bradyrhizobium sp. CCBAU 51753]QOZ27816.1 XRE family transcriptional regulator [Bradyrhizobium sp. CCBAU 51753]